MTLPDLSALSAADEAALAGLIAQVLAHAEPLPALSDAISELDTQQRPALAAALYEAVSYRVPVNEYWLQYRMAKAYAALGPAREDAMFYHAAATVRLGPDWSGSGQTYFDMFRFLLRRRRDREALDLFRYQMQHLPDLPAASPSEIADLLQRLGLPATEFAAAPPSHPDACRLHPVFAEETRAPWTCPVHGGDTPYALRVLAGGMTRPAITVAEFTEAEVLIYRNILVVLDRYGDLHEAFCVRDFPAFIRDWFGRREAAGVSVERHEAEEAVIAADEFPQANICHTLYDHVTRLALYQHVGVDTGRALVIDAEPGMPAQAEILRRAGVTAFLGTDRVARVRVKRLWVSSNCRQLCHAAHFGAPWAVAYVRQALGGQGSRGWRRLYISREDAAVRQVVNEAEVIALLAAHGFEMIVPGRMPYEAQLTAFRQASHIISVHGAALTHVVLCPPEAQLLEIFHPLYSQPAYAMQAAAAGLRYAAMLGRDGQSDAPHWNDPALTDVSGSRFLDRHLRVDLATLQAYLATAL